MDHNEILGREDTDQETILPGMEPTIYTVYARTGEGGKVERIFSDCFEQPQEGDISIKSGSGDEYVHVGYYSLYTAQRAHRYVMEGQEMREATEEELAAEIAAFPPAPETEAEKLIRVEAELTETQIALTEQYEANLALSEEITNTQIALTELYEGMGV